MTRSDLIALGFVQYSSDPAREEYRLTAHGDTLESLTGKTNPAMPARERRRRLVPLQHGERDTPET